MTLFGRFLCCCIAISAIGVVSGCNFSTETLQSNMESKQAIATEDETFRVYRFYLAATNEFNYNHSKYYDEYETSIENAQSRVPLASFKVDDFKRLEEELLEAKKAGHTFKDVEDATNELLPTLHELVLITSELDAYYKEKRYETDDFAFSTEKINKFTELKAIFTPKYYELWDAIDLHYKASREAKILELRSAGQINLAYTAEIKNHYDDIVTHIRDNRADSDLVWIKEKKDAADNIATHITSAEAQNFLDQQKKLDQAIDEFLAEPSAEGEYKIVLECNELKLVPMNYKLLDNTQTPKVGNSI